MKKFIYIISSVVAALSLASCTYLDVNPDLGMTEEIVFSRWDNYYKFFSEIYSGDKMAELEGVGSGDATYAQCNITTMFPQQRSRTGTKFTYETATDAAHMPRGGAGNGLKRNTNTNNSFNTWVCGRFPVLYNGYYLTRVANTCLENIDMLTDRAEHEAEVADMIAQCYFVRAYCHFEIMRHFGGMPYVDHALTSDEDWDLPRIPTSEMAALIAADFYKSYELFKEAGLMRRDSKDSPLKTDENIKPAGCAAIGMYARTLLYAASPLYNDKNDQSLWAKAADAAALAIKEASAAGFDLLPFSQWKLNWLGDKYVNEQIWAWGLSWNNNTGAYTESILGFPQASWKANAAGVNPTQNFVDRYENKWGDPLNTEADRAAAQALGHYNPQNPYVDMDPRFYQTIVFDGAKDMNGAGTKIINIYYDTAKKSWPTSTITGNNGKNLTFGQEWGSNDNKGITNTGYYSYKFWDGDCTKRTLTMADPLLRFADLYLMYAEAVNEAYGPNGSAGGSSLTAVAALNKVRSRAGMPDVRAEFTSDKNIFRDKVQNERNIELAFEGGHYYFDTHRWMTAPRLMTQTLIGMRVETCTKDAEHPNGKRYIRMAIPDNSQATWDDRMYFMRLPDTMIEQLENLDNLKW